MYDLAPADHALNYLSMEKVYDEWFNKHTKLREERREDEKMVSRLKRDMDAAEDQILSELQFIRTRINASSRILTDREQTAFFFVVIPEEMILIDTQKAAELFAKFDVPISGYVVNRVVPHELLSQDIPSYLRNRIEMQDKYLIQIDQTFGQLVTAHVPELERDVTGLDMIKQLSDIMYGNNYQGG